jgi:anti-anti-sigma factor
MTDPMARFRTEQRPSGHIVVTAAGEIDISNADELRHHIDLALRDAVRVAVDLAAVRYVDSQGMRVLAELARDTRDRDLVVVAPADSVAGELLALTQMDQLLTVREALDHDW